MSVQKKYMIAFGGVFLFASFVFIYTFYTQADIPSTKWPYKSSAMQLENKPVQLYLPQLNKTKESPSEADIFPYLNYSHFGMEWEGIIEELEWSYKNLDRKLTMNKNVFERGSGSYGLTSMNKSRLFLVPAKRSIQKGDYIHVVMEAYDTYGNRRLRGGDFIQATMSNEKLKKGTAGRVFDYGNGTYSIYFYAAWQGMATINVQLAIDRETIIFLKYLITLEDRERSMAWTVDLSDGTRNESIYCGIYRERTWENKCDFVGVFSLGQIALVCDKPRYFSCDDILQNKPKSRYLISMAKHKEDIKDVEYLFQRASNQPKGKPIEVLIKASKMPVTLKLPQCGPDLPVRLSSWINNLTFVPFTCRSQQWQKKDMVKCLSGKHLYLYGDSTMGQFHTQITDPTEMHILDRTDMTNYFTILRAGSDWRTFEQQKSASVFIDDTISCNSTIPILGLNFCFHFATWTTRSYLDRLFSVKFALQRLFKRCPNSIVIIKLAHPRDNVNSGSAAHSSNFKTYDMNRMVRRIFGGMGINFLDLWDFVLSHSERNDLHMPRYIIRQEVHYMFSYICPEMVKKKPSI